MHASIEQHRTEIARLCRRYAVRRLDVFGSAARGADFDPARGDADLLVVFEPGSSLHPLDQFFGLGWNWSNSWGGRLIYWNGRQWNRAAITSTAAAFWRARSRFMAKVPDGDAGSCRI